MRKILVALDYDNSAREVAETGHQLAKSLRAETALLHVVPEARYFSSLKYSPIMGYDNLSGFDEVETDRGSEAIRIAENFLDQFKDLLEDGEINTLVRTGEFSESILAAAAELDADMIVMGTHHRSGIERIFAGSVAEKVLHQSGIPVLVIPAKVV